MLIFVKIFFMKVMQFCFSPTIFIRIIDQCLSHLSAIHQSTLMRGRNCSVNLINNDVPLARRM